MVVCWSEKKRKFIPFATNVERSARRLIEAVPKEYRKRWGIETSFRKAKEIYGRTSSPSPAITLASFMTAMVLYNLWQLINIVLSTGHEKRKKGDGYRIIMPFMVTVLGAHLGGRL